MNAMVDGSGTLRDWCGQVPTNAGIDELPDDLLGIINSRSISAKSAR